MEADSLVEHKKETRKTLKAKLKERPAPEVRGGHPSTTLANI